MLDLIRRFLRLFDFNELRRQIDLAILWPSCKEQAPDLDHAKAAFAYHAFNDHAWTCLGEAEICRCIDALD
jgi:hypothetical protein